MTLIEALNKLESITPVWLAGMRAVGRYPDRPIRVYDFGERPFDTEDMHDPAEPWRWWQQPEVRDGGPYDGPYIPDPEDPATKGCLLEIIRRVTSDGYAYVTYMRFEGHWCVCWAGHEGVSSYISDGEALAQAIIVLAEEKCQST
jgi:hypothetical protein